MFFAVSLAGFLVVFLAVFLTVLSAGSSGRALGAGGAASQPGEPGGTVTRATQFARNTTHARAFGVFARGTDGTVACRVPS
ncbi:hypothetical protein ASG51_11550 [Methylobacterium sp. Leaf465]|nr:hypothetical protein ASG51_11550 [Methylobacterium sp. Leaf465]